MLVLVIGKFHLFKPLIILYNLTGCHSIVRVLSHNVGNNHIFFFRVEIENTADKSSESFHPAPTALDKCWLIKYSGLLKCTHNHISSYN